MQVQDLLKLDSNLPEMAALLYETHLKQLSLVSTTYPEPERCILRLCGKTVNSVTSKECCLGQLETAVSAPTVHLGPKSKD